MKRIRRLTDTQYEILSSMIWDWGHPFSCFNGTKKELRKEFKILREAGLVEFWKGLVDDDGMFAGSGYALNCKAKNIINKLIEDWENLKEKQ